MWTGADGMGSAVSKARAVHNRRQSPARPVVAAPSTTELSRRMMDEVLRPEPALEVPPGYPFGPPSTRCSVGRWRSMPTSSSACSAVKLGAHGPRRRAGEALRRDSQLPGRGDGDPGAAEGRRSLCRQVGGRTAAGPDPHRLHYPAPTGWWRGVSPGQRPDRRPACSAVSEECLDLGSVDRTAHGRKRRKRSSGSGRWPAGGRARRRHPGRGRTDQPTRPLGQQRGCSGQVDVAEGAGAGPFPPGFQHRIVGARNGSRSMVTRVRVRPGTSTPCQKPRVANRQATSSSAERLDERRLGQVALRIDRVGQPARRTSAAARMARQLVNSARVRPPAASMRATSSSWMAASASGRRRSGRCRAHVQHRLVPVVERAAHVEDIGGVEPAVPGGGRAQRARWRR